jgi:hypothetical protein
MLELVKCGSGEAWDRFVEASPQQNVFSTTGYLSALGVPYDAWFLTDSGKTVLGALVIEPLREDFEAPYDYSLYQGIFFAPDRSQTHSETRHRLGALEQLLARLGDIYSSLSFCLHPAMGDLRAVQWFNYHAPDQGRYAIHLHYTGIIDLEAAASFSDYLAGIRKVRIQECNKANRNGFRVRLSGDLDVFRDLYIKTFDRQGIVLEETKVERAVSIAKAAIENDFGRLFLCSDPDGKPASATVFLFDKASAYYLFGASDPSCRNTGASTFLLIESVRHFYDLGRRKIDMVGINSPNRGDFKTSFNAVPTPYFHITWRRPAGSPGGMSR